MQTCRTAWVATYLASLQSVSFLGEAKVSPQLNVTRDGWERMEGRGSHCGWYCTVAWWRSTRWRWQWAQATGLAVFSWVLMVACIRWWDDGWYCSYEAPCLVATVLRLQNILYFFIFFITLFIFIILDMWLLKSGNETCMRCRWHQCEWLSWARPGHEYVLLGLECSFSVITVRNQPGVNSGLWSAENEHCNQGMI